MNPPARLTIGALTFEPPVLLAPMAGYTDLPFRAGIRALGGVGLAYTEMLSPASLTLGKSRKRATLLATNEADRPIAYQIYGSRVAPLCDAARWLQDHGARLIDINMGCPQRKISTHGAGAGLLRDPGAAVRIAAEARDMTPALEDAGIAAITIHGRTRSQGYSGEADLAEIAAVVAAARRVPVIGNGDVTSPETARRLFDQTGCSAIMIGRGILRHPWLIREISNDLRGLPPAPAPTRAERIQFMRDHFERMVTLYGAQGGCLLYRKWIPLYVRPLLSGRPQMVEWLRVEDPDRMRQLMAGLDPAVEPA